MDITITPIFAAILAFIFFFHALRTIMGRGQAHVSLGDGGEDMLQRRIRIHGNFAEYIPFLLIIMYLLEAGGVNSLVLIAYGAAIVLGRVLHAYGLWSPETPGWARIAGMQLTLWPLVLGATFLLIDQII